jgi:hypothetical protein
MYVRADADSVHLGVFVLVPYWFEFSVNQMLLRYLNGRQSTVQFFRSCYQQTPVHVAKGGNATIFGKLWNSLTPKITAEPILQCLRLALVLGYCIRKNSI